MSFILFLILCLFGLNNNLIGFYTSFDHNIVLDSLEKHPSKQMSDEEVLHFFQVYFIKENFLNPAFSKRHKFFGEGEDEDEGEFTLNSDFEQDYAMEIMLKEVAKIMAEQNIFHLKEYLKREHHLRVDGR